jgi:hypothetical protein
MRHPWDEIGGIVNSITRFPLRFDPILRYKLLLAVADYQSG